MEIHAICKVSIPGIKTGKEQSSEVKRGRDPVYNQVSFFPDFSIILQASNWRLENVYHFFTGTKIVEERWNLTNVILQSQVLI